jgi:S-adenosylmethionine:tRNA-ribosyltransferase-isomerase (queuine synthetase)
MQKQTTAMQKLIDYLRTNFHLTESAEFEFEDSLLAEKEQIENAYDKGFSFGVAMLKQKQEVFINGEKYYKSNFDNSVVS